ncbi:MAG: DUF3472 domain-containing protein [Planctomycetota bacterium]|nr:DUF3472 domain-containing protein [Planctomycetota bacterium]
MRCPCTPFASFFAICVAISIATYCHAEELRVPAFTAYMLPNPESARFSEQKGITRWNDPAQSVNWYGKFAKSGELKLKVELCLPEGAQSRFKLTIGEESHEATVTGLGLDKTVSADFGVFKIAAVGHQRMQLESMNESKGPIGDIKALSLDGPATDQVHFNLKERRNAASVHLMYPTPEGTDIEAFYCEVTAIEDPTTTFYMACGWHRGYFGMQVNSPTERRIIFSVWDSGNEEVDRKKVNDENRVKLMGKGEGVFTGDFGNEGTGGHSHLKTMWKTGEKQRFLVTAKPVEKTTIFSGYWYRPDERKWMLISSWRAPKEGGWLRGVHSFSENFGGSNGHLLRKARYGNQWIRTPENKWVELTNAKFSHDPTGRADRFDRYMGVENGEFFLSHGGFVDGFVKYGDMFTREKTGKSPSDLELPKFDVAP